MRTEEGINTRILQEVDKLAISKARKDLLQALLSFQLGVYDQAQPAFKEKYKQLISKTVVEEQS